MISAARYRAWRFVHPDIVAEEGALSGGLQVTPRGRIDMVQDDASIRQSLLLLLSTSPGERVMRPDYGCYLRRLVFAPNDDDHRRPGHPLRPPGRGSLGATRRDHRRGCRSATSEPGPENLQNPIVLDYRVRATRRAEAIAYSMDLTGEAR